MQTLARLAAGAAALSAAAGALAGVVSTRTLASLAQVREVTIDGFEFTARGDTAALHVSRADPPAEATQAYALWNNGFAHAFRVIYSGGVASLGVDDVYVQHPATIATLTNGVVLTSAAPHDGAVVLENLRIAVPPFEVHDVGAAVLSEPGDYLLIETDLPLADGFILSGTVTFEWSGALPPAGVQWFETATVTVPAPALCGDSNCDGAIDFDDMDCFIAALVSREAWEGCGHSCALSQFLEVNDTNGDRLFNFDDIDGFIQALIFGACPGGGGGDA